MPACRTSQRCQPLHGKVVGFACTGGIDDARRRCAQTAGNAAGRLVYSSLCGSACLMVGIGIARVAPLSFAEALQHLLVHRGVGRVIQIEHKASCNINTL